MALALYFLCDYQAAVDVANEVLRLYPNHPLSYRNVAAALGQLGRTVEARSALDQGISIAPAIFDITIVGNWP